MYTIAVYSLLHWSLHHQPAVYMMIQCTEPATPAGVLWIASLPFCYRRPF